MRLRGSGNRSALGLLFGTCVFVIIFLIMWFSPYASDDIEFKALGLRSFGEIAKNALYYGNGRLLGNISVFYLVNNRLAGCIVRAASITLIIVFLPCLTGMKTILGYSFSFLLVLTINAKIFGQVFSWASGFSNYAFPILLGLFVLILLDIVEKDDCKKAVRIFGVILIFVFGSCAQLFVENTSSTFVVLSGAMLCNGIWRKQRFIASRLAWVISAFVGMIVMLLIPRIFYIDNNRVTDYRGFGGNSFLEAINNAIKAFGAILDAYVGSTVLLIIVFACIVLLVKKEMQGIGFGRYLSISSEVAAAFVVTTCFLRQTRWYGDEFWTNVIDMIGTKIWALVLLINLLIAVHYISEKKVKRQVLFVLFFSIISVAQLLVVYPVAERTAWISLIFTSVALMLLLKYLLTGIDSFPIFKVEKAVVVFSIVFGISLVFTFANIHQMDSMRESHVESEIEKGKTEIDIFAIPSDYAFWDGEWAYREWKRDLNGNKVKYNVLNVDNWIDIYIYRADE